MGDGSRLTDNKLLAALPRADRERLRANLRLVVLPFGRAIHRPGVQRTSVYFPIDCVLSKQFLTSSGDAAEVASIGNEGLVGTPLLLGATATPLYTVVEVAGSAWCADAMTLRRELERSADLRSLVQRFVAAEAIQIAQNAICYQHHSIEQQFCLWLLLLLDRSQSPLLHLTQDVIGRTIGVRRESINEVISRFARRRVIRHARGVLEVLDRQALEQACCECYAVITSEYARLLPRAL